MTNTPTDRETVKRYAPTEKDILWEDANGFWVKASDYDALLAAKEAAEAERDALREKLEALQNPPEQYCVVCGAPRSNHPYRHMFVARDQPKEGKGDE